MMALLMGHHRFFLLRNEGTFYDTFADVISPGELFLSDGVKLGSQRTCIRLATGFVLLLPLGHSPVEGEARNASSLSKMLRLFRRRVKPDLVRFDHP